MISSIVIINQRGDVLIYRIYKDDITRTETLNFCTKIIADKEKKETPILFIDGTTFFWVAHQDIIIVATTKSNINCGMVFHFLYSVIDLLKAYFGDEPNEGIVKKNFVLIYELMDEIIDFGIPQFTEPQALKQFILEGGLKLENLSEFDKLKQLTTMVTGATNWRPEGIRYNKNQVYIDVIESVNVLFSADGGSVLKADVSGRVQVKAELTGMPECKFGMNDKFILQRDKKGMVEQGINIDDLKFDRCVKLSKFDKERAITFIPPDATFDLMTYRISENVNLPFKIMGNYQATSPLKFEFDLKLKAIFDQKFSATTVVIKIPVPKNTINTNCNANKGRSKHEPDQQAIMWRIKKLQGGSETLIRGLIELSQDGQQATNWPKPPISINFSLPMCTASGLVVRTFRVFEKGGYHTTKWIRYLTQSGDYLCKI